MKKIFNIMKNNYMYLLLFLFILIWNLLLSRPNIDEVWNYGFAHNIYSGLIPYKDFNMIITPLYPMIISFFFLFFGSDILIMHIFNALMITHMFYILSKLGIHNKLIILLLLCFPLTLLFPSYNLFLLYLFVLLIYFEKKRSNDYLIGILIALIVLTKQTVGFFFLVANILLLHKDNKRLIKRIISCVSILLLFVFYLILTKSFNSFFDLCFLGLFDFSKSNSHYFNILFYPCILLLFFFLFKIRKNYQDYTYVYLLCFMVNVIPLFDVYHFNLFIVANAIVLFMKKNIDFKININIIIIVAISCLSFSSFNDLYNEKSIYPNKIPKFNYRYLTPNYIYFTEEVNKKIKEYKDKKVIIVGAEGYYFKLINDERIDKFDLLNMGNNGYNGDKKLVLSIKKMKNAIFFVDKKEQGEFNQTNQELIKYILKYGTKIDKVCKYTIYKL